MSFYDHLPVLKKSGQVWTGGGRGVENWQKGADIFYRTPLSA